MNKARLTIGEARRMVLAAQGFHVPRPSRVTRRHILATIRRLGLIQIDSVNVLVRAQYMPFFSRLGPYEPRFLDELAYHPKGRRLFEYWGHEASLIDLTLLPYFRWRMDRAALGNGTWSSLARIAQDEPEKVEQVYEIIRRFGPIDAGKIEKNVRSAQENGAKRGAGWWNWSDTKKISEYLFWAGKITTSSRRNFARLYDLSERVLPAASPISPEAAHRELVSFAASALGVATERDLRDYFRLRPADAASAIVQLVHEKKLTSVEVKGWKNVAYLPLPMPPIPRRSKAAALLSPFDPLLWERSRAERLFDFRYRIEIYTPLAKRLHGYYVLPFLYQERIVARLDLKADREKSVLLVLSAHAEDQDFEFLPSLADELRRLASWLRLTKINVRIKGSLAVLLEEALGRP